MMAKAMVIYIDISILYDSMPSSISPADIHDPGYRHCIHYLPGVVRWAILVVFIHNATGCLVQKLYISANLHYCSFFYQKKTDGLGQHPYRPGAYNMTNILKDMGLK